MSEEVVIRPADYNDFLYRPTYYLLGKIAPYIPRSIHPNQITFMAFTSAILSCIILYFNQPPAAYLYWVLFNFIWFLLDALDGIHARISKQSSEFGGFLDHFLDNVFFVVMFTVFTLKFDLAYPLYMCAIILRITGALMVFLVQVHTKRLYLGIATGGLELLLLSAVMVLSYLFPNFDLSQHVSNPQLLYWVNLLHLQQGVFMKLALLVYIIGVPIYMCVQYRFVRRCLS